MSHDGPSNPRRHVGVAELGRQVELLANVFRPVAVPLSFLVRALRGSWLLLFVQSSCLRQPGGLGGGSGAYFANAGEDLHAVGSLDPLVPGYVGCIVIKPDGSH
jgi:hypothetical protein